MALELMNGISERTHESYTADIICHIEVQIDDHMALQMDQAYWTVGGRSRWDWGMVRTERGL
jgi:hypothetical protein